MSVPAKKNSRSRVRRRRSRMVLKKKTILSCQKCDAAVLPHRACPSCGFYKNRQAVEGSVEDVIEKKIKKSKTKKEAKSE